MKKKPPPGSAGRGVFMGDFLGVSFGTPGGRGRGGVELFHIRFFFWSKGKKEKGEYTHTHEEEKKPST